MRSSREVVTVSPYISGALVVTACLSLASCGSSSTTQTDTVHVTAAERGRALFADPKASGAPYNRFACGTCHAVPGDATDRIVTGAPMVGVVGRPSYWGNQETDLLSAINDCRRLFMEAPAPWSSDREEAKDLYAYLLSLSPEPTSAPWPFRLTEVPGDVPAGDPTHGEDVDRRACRPCHGGLHTGAGRIAPEVPVLPDETLASHASYSPKNQRLVFVEKVRHGGFYGYGGDMPPFSVDVLSDADLGALLAFFELYR